MSRKKRTTTPKANSLEAVTANSMDTGYVTGEDPGIDSITITIPVRRIAGMPAVKRSTQDLTGRQARARRIVYDGFAAAGINPRDSWRTIGTTAPHWHADSVIYDMIADAVGLPESSRDPE